MDMYVGPGVVRAIHDDDFPLDGAPPPVRASCVEPIQRGLFSGFWFVDMSPLGESYRYCLWPPCRRRDEALAAERAHLVANWLVPQNESAAHGMD